MHIYFSVELPNRPKATVLCSIQGLKKKGKKAKKTHKIGDLGESPIFLEILTFWQFSCRIAPDHLHFLELTQAFASATIRGKHLYVNRFLI